MTIITSKMIEYTVIKSRDMDEASLLCDFLWTFEHFVT